ncbi:ABC transporter permease [Streptomyces sp. SHP 1-2]|uniref:ABC transporter permease n=1 Tax=Streptomyces sp. SHP 1-2 TaxID=2769489 RepID=UPI0022383595|nr:ABC transporter permease [Streptomyces sp. SHP 1-2]MCW5251144.1 ABC transporter permease [Streptomyces sp. SHP 1-2]
MSAYSALTAAGYRAQVRDRTTVFFTFAFPLIFLVVFGLIFRGRDVEESGYSYLSYTASGVLSWGVANAAVFGIGFTLMQWRVDDILRMIRMSPAPLSSVIGSRFVLALVVGAVQSALFVGVAMLPGFGLVPDSRWPLLIPVMVLGIITFLMLGVIIGSVADTPESVAGIANFLMLPMAFLSGSFFPLDSMPDWLRKLSLVMPLRYLNDAVSGSLTGRGDLSDIATGCAGLLVFTVVLGAVAMRAFRWTKTS